MGAHHLYASSEISNENMGLITLTLRWGRGLDCRIPAGVEGREICCLRPATSFEDVSHLSYHMFFLMTAGRKHEGFTANTFRAFTPTQSEETYSMVTANRFLQLPSCGKDLVSSYGNLVRIIRNGRLQLLQN